MSSLAPPPTSAHLGNKNGVQTYLFWNPFSYVILGSLNSISKKGENWLFFKKTQFCCCMHFCRHLIYYFKFDRDFFHPFDVVACLFSLQVITQQTCTNGRGHC